MKHVSTLARQQSPVWVVDISNDPITDLKRTLEADALYIASWGVVLRGMIIFKDNLGNTITAGRYKSYFISLTAGLDETGPFIDPETGDRVYPDTDGMVPDNTILRYDGLMYRLNSNVNINAEVLNYIAKADLNGEFDV